MSQSFHSEILSSQINSFEIAFALKNARQDFSLRMMIPENEINEENAVIHCL